jgi:transcriptional regulatory protein LevR
MQKAGVQANNAMTRMVSLKEIDELVTKGLIGANSTDSGLWYLIDIGSLTSIATINLPKFMRSTTLRMRITTMPQNSWHRQSVKKLLS